MLPSLSHSYETSKVVKVYELLSEFLYGGRGSKSFSCNFLRHLSQRLFSLVLPTFKRDEKSRLMAEIIPMTGSNYFVARDCS
jgi:hypothetical protein